jgi:glycine/D-amino acid oxidase-like deaminating enzyme
MQWFKGVLTWYEATAVRGAPRAALAGMNEADDCIIGGGLAGIAAALELARRGRRVLLLEARRLAWAASGRNGGFVSNGFAEAIAKLRERIGLDAARSLYRLSAFGTEYLRREIGGDPATRMGEGMLIARRYRDPEGVAAYRDMMERDFDEYLEVLSVAETRARLNSTRYFEGLFNPRAFHVHPLRMALMLAARAEAAGAVLCEESRATGIAREGGRYRIATPGGTVVAQNVVHCVSALDRSLHGPTARAILPVATYVAVSEPMVQDAIAPGPAYSDRRRAGDYFRVVDDGRILWGGRISTRVSEPSRLAERMKRDMVAVFPQLAPAAMQYAWSGIMGYALHRMPLIGTDGRGQWFATAFGGHGLNTAAMAGQLIARAIAGGDDEYRRFAVFAPQWAGGSLGRLGVQATYWWMQLRDRIDERRAG